MRKCLPNPTKIKYIRFFFFLQVKTELMTQGGAQCGGLHSQTKTRFQPSVAWPRRPPARGRKLQVLKDSLVPRERRLPRTFQLKVTLLVKYFLK